jgi:hypothetical protein
MTFAFKFEEDGRRWRIVFEERIDATTGTRRLVATQMDGEFSADEMQRAYADALAKWLHPNEPPGDWFE